MNKKELAMRIASKMSIPQKQALLFMKRFEEIVEETILKEETISLQGFGSLSVWRQTERQGRNPRTGVPACINARNSVKFKPGSNLLKAINPNRQ